jgi:Tfp pilus assembly major pilin PilA
VSDVRDLWVGQNGEKLGPYTDTEVRQWMAEGRFRADALGWRAGMASWAPLITVLRGEATPPPPRPLGERTAAPQPQQRYYARDNVRSSVTLPEPFSAGQPMAPRGYNSSLDRSAIPTPPTLHWGLVFLFSILSLGIFGMVWQFIQASWVRKVDRHSKAMLYLGLGVSIFVLSYVIQFMGGSLAKTNPASGGLLALLGLGMLLAYSVLLLMGYFSMADSIRRAIHPYGPAFDFGGVTLFFLNIYYIQGHLTWIGRWKQTGQTEPRPPKEVLWVILLFIPVAIAFIAIVAAIAIPAYQDYTVRAQAQEGVTISDDVRTHVQDFYKQNKRYPDDNTEATLAPADQITGKYVSKVEVDHGNVVVYFGTAQTNRMIAGKFLVYRPSQNGDVLRWECKSESSVVYKFLPAECR